FRGWLAARVALAAAGATLLASATAEPLAGPAAGGRLAVGFVAVAGGELIGRWLFYVTVVPYRVAGSFFQGR
ncbi:MAG: hypothetical protein ACRD0D_10995, partial [Acidimicrobiales bacterium]